MPRQAAGGVERVLQQRLSGELSAALKRRPSREEPLAGVLLVASAYSAPVRSLLATCAATLLRRKTCERPLFAACMRALVEASDARAPRLLAQALSLDDGGGLAALSAACFCPDPALSGPLARLASGRQLHLAFAAEVARVARGESAGATLLALAPKLKEASRTALCLDVFLPLVRGPALAAGVTPALAVLRDAERHMGRWLVLGEVAVRAGDEAPRAQASGRAGEGSASARVAWALVAWALQRGAPAPALKPPLDVLYRLSDRPSTSRDLTFLFRLAEAGSRHVRALLDGLARGGPSEIGVRAAMFLARDPQPDEPRRLLDEAARSRQDGVRGLAAAVLHDLGEVEAAAALLPDCLASRSLAAVGWASLVHAAREGKVQGPLVTETTYRRLVAGWFE